MMKKRMIAMLLAGGLCLVLLGLLDEALAKRSMPTQNRNVIYLILQVIGLGFVGWILMQSTINSMIPDAA